jgi:hypothetical protein
MQVLVARAGLTLNPGQMADLVLGWRQVVGLMGLISRDRPLVDDQAFVFRLPPPDGSAWSAAGTATGPFTGLPAGHPQGALVGPRALPAAPHAGKQAAPRKTARPKPRPMR